MARLAQRYKIPGLTVRGVHVQVMNCQYSLLAIMRVSTPVVAFDACGWRLVRMAAALATP